MQGTTPIIFREPVGGDCEGDEEPFDHPVVYCIRKDRAGAGGELLEGVVATEAMVELRFREDSLSKRPDNTWRCIDERDVNMKVEDVYEANSGPRSRWLIALCRRVDL